MKVKLKKFKMFSGNNEGLTIGKVYEVILGEDSPNVHGTVDIIDDLGNPSALWVEEYEEVK